jgi:S1-C subfamily serine protease
VLASPSLARISLYSVALALIGCGDRAASEGDAASGDVAVATAPAWLDASSLDALLDESIDVAPGGSMVVVDGWVARLAVDPLIAGRSPVRLTAEGDGAVRISEVPEGSPWARIGLRDGDLLVKVDGKSPGAELDALRQRYAECPREVAMELQRDGQALTIRLEINVDRTWKSRDSSSTAAKEPRSSLDDVLEDAIGEDDRNTLPGVGLLADHVRCRDEAHCEVSVALVDAYKATPGAFARQARVVPAVDDGVTRGIKFYGIRPGSLPKLLGCKNGDMLTRIDGDDANDVGELVARLPKLGRGDRLRLEYERKGETRSLEIEIVAAFAAGE